MSEFPIDTSIPQFNDNAIKRILFDLDTVSKLQRGEIIDTSDDFMTVSEANIITSVMRTITRDSRNKALKRIAHEIRTVHDIADIITESKYLHIYEKADVTEDEDCAFQRRLDSLRRIAKSLHNAVSGLQNFTKTYAGDTNLVGETDNLIGEIKIKVEHIEQKIRVFEEQEERYNR